MPNEFNIYTILDDNQVLYFSTRMIIHISAYKKINFLDDIYIQINRNINKKMWQHYNMILKNFMKYITLKEEESAGIQITFCNDICIIFSLFYSDRCFNWF